LIVKDGRIIDRGAQGFLTLAEEPGRAQILA
jgi:hypothetical protein